MKVRAELVDDVAAGGGREDGGEIRQAEHADAVPPGPAAGVLARPQLAVVSGHRSVVLTQLSTDHNLLSSLKLA